MGKIPSGFGSAIYSAKNTLWKGAEGITGFQMGLYLILPLLRDYKKEYIFQNTWAETSEEKD